MKILELTNIEAFQGTKDILDGDLTSLKTSRQEK